VARPRIELVITDLDNTLYDWVGWFSRGVTELVSATAAILHVTAERVVDELRDEHVRRGTVEDADAVLDLPIVRAAFGTADAARCALASAMTRAASSRAVAPPLYPGVRTTLRRLRQRGVTIVGHTEAPAAAAVARIRALRLHRELSVLYARMRTQGVDSVAPPIRVLDPSHAKPDPEAVLEICADAGVSPDRTLYVGDNLARDVGMARRAGAFAAWASYGTRHAGEDWDVLKRVSHWRAEDVRRFEDRELDVLRAAAHVTLEESFAEILSLFQWGVAARAASR
jgi:FMN phosphatase YigB (HAD superfamily)